MVRIRVIENGNGELVFNVNCKTGSVISRAYSLRQGYNASKSRYAFETPREFRYIVEEEIGEFMDRFGRPVHDLDKLSDKMEYAPFLAAYLESLGFSARVFGGSVVVYNTKGLKAVKLAVRNCELVVKGEKRERVAELVPVIRELSADPTGILGSFLAFQRKIRNKTLL